MTCRELLAIEHPENVGEKFIGGCDGCPSDYGYAEDPEYCSSDQDSYPSFDGMASESRYLRCKKCWDREVSDETMKKFVNEGPKVLDSGDRTEFPSGAVRDCRVGKGRCDLMPLDVVANLYPASGNISAIFGLIAEFQRTGYVDHLYDVLDVSEIFDNRETMLLEVAKQFEEGAKKYGDDNWRKGIPVHCYIDSAIRHYLKYLRGDQDEPHDRAFCWNILCCIWTVKHIENGGESNGEGH